MRDRIGRENSNIFVLLSFLLCVPIFLLDLLTSRGSADPLLYMVPILIVTYYSRNIVPLLLIGLVAIGSTMVGYCALAHRDERLLPGGHGVRDLRAGHGRRSGLLYRSYVERTIEIGRLNDELSENNRRLEEIKKELEATNGRLEQRTRSLDRSNTDLKRFAYIASHDLKSAY